MKQMTAMQGDSKPTASAHYIGQTIDRQAEKARTPVPAATIAIDQRELRNVLGSFVTGVTVVTTLDKEGRPQGVTANSFSSVSLDPPLVLWSQSLKANSFPAFRDSEHFIVNILAHHQVDVSQRFAKAGEDKFAGVELLLGNTGLPIIKGCTAFLECRKIATYPGGDHAVFLGQVENFQRNETRPLAFSGGKYMLAYVHDLGAVDLDQDDKDLRQVHALQMANAALPDICSRLGASVGLAVWGNKGPTVIRWELSARAAFKDLHTGIVVSPILSACGRAFSAFLTGDRALALIDAAFKHLQDTGASAIPTREAFNDQLAAIRRQGVSQVMPPRFGPDIAACAAPVFDRHGRIVMALTVVDTIERLGTSHDGPVQKLLREEAQQLSRRLGY